MKGPQAYVDLAQRGVRRAEEAGADEAEVFVWRGSGDRVMKGGDFQMAQESDQSGVSVRLLRGSHLARATTDGIAEADLDWAIDRALDAAGFVPESPSFDRFPEPTGDVGSPTDVDEAVMDPDVDRLIGVADHLGEQVKQARGIDYFEVVSGAYRGTYALANSQGLTAWDRNAYERCGLELRFEHGGEHRYTRRAVYSRAPIDYDTELEAETDEAIRLVQRTEDRASLDEAASTVLFDAVAASTVLGRLIPAIRGLAAHRESTPFADALGEQIAVEELSLVDEPRGSDAVRLQRTDDEGIPTQRTPIVEDGVLETHLYDWASALETDQPPTGHGFRPRSSRHEGAPGAGTCNLEVEPGDWSTEELIEDVDHGVLVKGPFLGSFTSSPVTGDFSLVAPLAFEIEGGKLGPAVPSTTVSGNLFEALETIRAIGSEAVRTVSGSAVPLLVDEVTAVA